MKPTDRILDVGPDRGEVTYILEQGGFGSVYGVDVGDFRSFPTQNFIIFDGIRMPFRDSFFDLVALNFVLHHVPNDDKAILLKEAQRVARGYLFIMEDTPKNPLDWFMAYRHGVKWQRKITGHPGFGFYTKPEWEGIFKSLGLRLVISKELGRFSRNKRQPFARSLFVLGK